GLTIGACVTLRWTISNGVCPSTNDDVIICIDESPTVADANSDQSLCNVSVTSLSGNSPTVGTGSWRVVSGTAVITDSTDPNTGITGLVVGTSVTLRWTISNASCPFSSDEVVINVDKLPTLAAAGTDQ